MPDSTVNKLASSVCRPTEHDALGPFYWSGAPFRARLAGPDEPGDRLMLAGTVFASGCRTPLPGALRRSVYDLVLAKGY